MENPAFTRDDGDEAKKKDPEIVGQILNGPEDERKSDVPEAFRYSSEKKALEALDDAVTSVDLNLPADKPYAGMGKEDLLRFSQTPFWNRFRMACTIIFWLAWIGLLTTVIVLVVTFPQCSPPPEKSWYQTSVIYQIYVRSFYDYDGDGVGDINGIRSKLDYLDSINVDAIMLSSIYESRDDQVGTVPVDYGYEVINHMAIDPTYGTMSDFEMLLTEAHDMDMKVIMEFIPNYTGKDHPWFIASSSDASNSNPMWNYYVWADCATTPNNWMSVYSELAWTNDPTRSQCYLHQFLDSQPELNLRSAAVQDELETILRFWLNKGVDGFRVDKVMYLYEDTDLRNETSTGTCMDQYECYDHGYTKSQDEIYPLVAKWRSILDEFTSPDGVERILLTDAMDNINNSALYYGKYGPDGAHLPLNFELTKITPTCNGKCVFELVDNWLYNTPVYGTSDWMTGTQNMARLADVIPQDSWDDWGYQNAITLLKMTLPGAAVMYYGEEIGMTSVNSTMTNPSDPAGAINLAYSRDPYRSPMQWNNGSNAGFINETMDNDTIIVAEPWLPVGTNLFNISIEAQNGTDFTPFTFYSELASMRRTEETFSVGNLQYTLLTNEVISYYREYEGRDRFLVAINFGNSDVTVNIATSHYDIPTKADVVMTTREDMSVSPGDSADLRSLFLKPGDGMMATWPYERPDGKPKNM